MMKRRPIASVMKAHGLKYGETYLFGTEGTRGVITPSEAAHKIIQTEKNREALVITVRKNLFGTNIEVIVYSSEGIP